MILTASVTHLRIEERLFYTGELAQAYVFSWDVRSLNRNDWITDNAAIREELKESVPPEDRGWDQIGKRWFVKVEYRPTLAKLFSNFEAELGVLKSSPTLF
jgi:hypothetical protein